MLHVSTNLMIVTLFLPFHSSLNSYIAADDVTKVLKSVGIEAESDRLNTLIENLKGKKLHELIQAGSSKLSTLSGNSHSFFVM